MSDKRNDSFFSNQIPEGGGRNGLKYKVISDFTYSVSCDLILKNFCKPFKLPGMEAIILDADDEKFLQQAVKFCNNIDKYRESLHLDLKDIALFKGDVNLAVYISSRYPSFTASFIQYNISTLRQKLIDLANACYHSKRYNRHMGVELGIETPGQETEYPVKVIGTWFLGMLNQMPNHS